MQGQYRGDFTRDTFDSLKHFSRVLMQQGRVNLDADWNEQTAILLRYLQALAADLIGPHGGPVDNWGFAITPIQSTPPVTGDFRIGPGHYYVEGILCELDSAPVPIVPQASASGSQVQVQVQSWTVDGLPFQSNQYVEVFDDVQPPVTPAFAATVVQVKNPDQTHGTLALQGAPSNLQSAKVPKLRRVMTYLSQPDYPTPDPLQAGQSYQVYLDVWERHITYVEDDSIREVALRGPDTATRAKVVWQVKITPAESTGNCLTEQQLNDRFQRPARGRLKAMAKQGAKSTDPCIIPPDARYSGAENQLYRVEIHRQGGAWDGSDNGKTTAATFKWSRENGSVVFPIVSGGGTATVTLENLGRDDRFGLVEGDWVEIQDDDSVLKNGVQNLLQVQIIDRPSMTVTLSGSPAPNIGSDGSKHPLLRRWDQKEGDPAEGGLQLGSDNAALVVEGTGDVWLTLEDGVQIQFQPPGQGANQYRTGDYWLIPARTATGDVEWPREKDSEGDLLPIALPPHGVEHHYAPLAIITMQSAGNVLNVPLACRKKFETVVELSPQT
jgi:hypothetical protein